MAATSPINDRETVLRITGYAMLAAFPFFFLFGLPILPKASTVAINPIVGILWLTGSHDLQTVILIAIGGGLLLTIMLGGHLVFALRDVPRERPSRLFLKVLWHHFLVTLPLTLISVLLVLSTLLPGGGGESGGYAALIGIAGLYLVISTGVLVLLATAGVVGWLSGHKTATAFVGLSLLIFFSLWALLILGNGCSPSDTYCYAQLAEVRHDDQICRQLEQERDADRCFEIVARSTGDARVCLNSRSGFGECVYDVIDLTNQTQYCSLLDDDLRCFLDFAKKRRDCTIIPEENLDVRASCYFTQAVKENDCSIIPPQHTVARQACPETARKHATLAPSVQEGMWYGTPPE